MGKRSDDKWFVHLATRWCSYTPGLRDCAAAKRANRRPTFGPKIWPPNSFDLNPVDYRIWGLLQEYVYIMSIRDLKEFK